MPDRLTERLVAEASPRLAKIEHLLSKRCEKIEDIGIGGQDDLVLQIF